jgi:uncharacterized protein
VTITCNGGKLPSHHLIDDQQDKPDYLELGKLIFVVIKRGSSTLIRVWDRESPNHKAFLGLNFYPFQPEYRVTAEYFGYAPFKSVKQKDIIGEISERKMIGYAEFSWEGKQYRLDAEDGGDGLFIAFRDQTSAKTTYPGGRYLMTEKPHDGQVIIDFNKAYNMPCAYTVYATCSLPTPVPVEAGEKKYKDEH